MKVFAIEHEGVYLGGMSIAVAETEDQAREQLKFALNDMKLKYTGEEKLIEIDPTKENFYVLWNGDY
jgi:ribonuclease PH